MNRNIQIKLKPQNVFKTSLFQNILNEYFQTIFSKIFENYNLTPAKGGSRFEQYSDMNYPMHILNGILPAMLYLEQKLLENEHISELVSREDSDIKMVLKCTLLGITLHDINKLVRKSNLRESLEYLDEVLNKLGLELSNEEKNIIKYLIISAEDRTRYTIPDGELPKRRNLNRIIKDYLLEVVHLADSISIPPEDSFSHTFRQLQKELQSYFPEVHTFYFHDSPYEVLSRYLLIKLITKIEGKILLISPKGFIWVGKPLNIEDIKDILHELETEYLNLFINQIDSFLTCDWQKAQLDIFRYVTPTKDFVKDKLIPMLLERKRDLILYHGLPSDEVERETIRKKIEKLEANGKLYVMVVFKLILTLTPNNDNVKNLKKEKEEKYFTIKLNKSIINLLENEDKKGIIESLKLDLDENDLQIEKKGKNIWKIKIKGEKYFYEIKEKDNLGIVKINTNNPVLRNAKKIIGATNEFNGNVDKLYDDLVELLIENYKEEAINIKEVVKTVLSYAYLDNSPVFEIKVQDIGDKQNICSICGAKANIAVKEGIAFGFSSCGFTNRVVVSIKSNPSKGTGRKICKTCLAEVMLRKLIFGRSKDLYAVYMDACDYTVPILNAEKVVEKIEEQINGIQALSNDIFNSYRIFYGYPFKESKSVLIPFLMAHLQTGKEADFLRRFYELLIFASNTGFKVYLTYAMNPDRIKKETFVLDYAPKSIKTLGWDRIRIDKLQHVRNEFEILMSLAKTIGGRRWQNEFVRVLNDYSASPLAFFYYLYRLENPFSFINKNQDKVRLVYERIGGEIMGVIEKLADKASEIEWSGYTASKQTWIIRTAIDALKTGVQRKLGKEDIIALMAGIINKKIRFLKKDEIDDFCRTVYEELYEKTWNGKIPSKTELRYWTYAFAFEYAKKSDEKRKKKKEEKQREGGRSDE